MSSNHRLALTIWFFLIVASLTLLFLIWTGVNVPLYYPVENTWRTWKVSGAIAMGFYGKTGVALLVAVVLSFIFWLTLPWKKKELDHNMWSSFALLSLLVGTFFFIAEEGHTWWIEKEGLATKNFWNLELLFFACVLVGFSILLKLLIWAGDKAKKQ